MVGSDELRRAEAMKCPKCAFITSNTNDICPRCSFDLRRRKSELGIRVANPQLSKEELINRMDDSEKQAAEFFEESALQAPADEKKGFFGRLFGRSGKSESDTVITTIIEEMEPAEFEDQTPQDGEGSSDDFRGDEFSDDPVAMELGRSGDVSDAGAGLNEILPHTEPEEATSQEFPESDVFQILNTLHTPAEAFSESLEESIEEARNAAEQLRVAAKMTGSESSGEVPQPAMPRLRSELMANSPTVSPKVLEIGDDFDLDGALDELLGGEQETVTTVAVESEKKHKPLKKAEPEDEFEFSFEIEEEGEEETPKLVATPDEPAPVESAEPVVEPPILEESRDVFLDELVENLRSIEAQAEQHSIAAHLDAEAQALAAFAPPPQVSQILHSQPAPAPTPPLAGDLDRQRVAALQKAQEVMAKLGTVDQSVLSELTGVIANAYGIRPETFTPPPSRPESEFEVADRQEVVERESIRAKLAKFGTTEPHPPVNPVGEISSLEAELYGEMKALEAGGTHVFSMPENRPGLQETEALAEGYRGHQPSHQLPPNVSPSEEHLLSIESGLLAELSNLHMEALGDAVDGSTFTIEVEPLSVSEAPSPLAEMEEAVENSEKMPEPGVLELGLVEGPITSSGSHPALTLVEEMSASNEPLKEMEQDAIFRELESLLSDDMGEPPLLADMPPVESPVGHVAVLDSSPELAALDTPNLLTEVPLSPQELGLEPAEAERLRLKILRSKPTQIFSRSDLAFLRNLPPLPPSEAEAPPEAVESSLPNLLVEAPVDATPEAVVESAPVAEPEPIVASELAVEPEALHSGSEIPEAAAQFEVTPELSSAAEVPDLLLGNAEATLSAELDSLLGAVESEFEVNAEAIAAPDQSEPASDFTAEAVPTASVEISAAPAEQQLSETEALLSDELDSLLGASTDFGDAPETSAQEVAALEPFLTNESLSPEPVLPEPHEELPALTGIQAELSDELDALLSSPLEPDEPLEQQANSGNIDVPDFSISQLPSGEHISIAEGLSELEAEFEAVVEAAPLDAAPEFEHLFENSSETLEGFTQEESSEPVVESEDLDSFLFQEDDILAHVSQAAFHGDTSNDETLDEEDEPMVPSAEFSMGGIGTEPDFEGLFDNLPNVEPEDDIFAVESDLEESEDEEEETEISFDTEDSEVEYSEQEEGESEAEEEFEEPNFEEEPEVALDDEIEVDQIDEPAPRLASPAAWNPPKVQQFVEAPQAALGNFGLAEQDDETSALWGFAFAEIAALQAESDDFEISSGELSSFMQTATIDVLFNSAIEEVVDPEKLAARLSSAAGNTLRKIDSRELETAVLKYQREEKIYRSKQAERRMRPARTLDQIPLGKVGARFLAFTLDALAACVAVFFIAIFFVFPEPVRRELFLLQAPNMDDLLPNLFPVFQFALFFWIVTRALTVLGYGAGPGGRLFGLEVVDYEGRALGPKQAILRACAELTCVITLGLSVIPVIGKTRRTLHDRLAKTLVAKRSNIGMVPKSASAPVRPSHTGKKIVSKPASKRTPAPKAPKTGRK